MICPIKLNNTYWLSRLLSFLPNEDDPSNLFKGSQLSAEEFSKYIESIYFGGKFSKTTMPKRHKLTDELIKEILKNNKNFTILDVGASDGSTSIDLINTLNHEFQKFYVTDVSFTLHVMEVDGKSYFYDSVTKECIMITNDRLIIYYDKLSRSPLGNLANNLIKKAPKYDKDKVKELYLCQPELQRLIENNNRIKIVEWSVLEPWPYEKVDLIKVANVLKTEVFSDDEIIRSIRNLTKSLNPGGKMLITRNLEEEKYSLFFKDMGKLKLEKEKNGGCEITYLVKKANQ
jgi:hypothetical protein